MFRKRKSLRIGKKARNSDWESTRRKLTSDVKQTRSERELEEKEKESFISKQLFFRDVSHKTKNLQE